MAPTYLLSTALMGVLVLGLAVAVARGRAWHEYRPTFAPGERLPSGDDQSLLTAGFLLLIVLVLGGTLFAAGGGNVAVFVGVIAALFVGFLAVGVYATARSNGHPHSHAVGEAIATLGAVVLVVVVAWLLTTAGA